MLSSLPEYKEPSSVDMPVIRSQNNSFHKKDRENSRTENQDLVGHLSNRGEDFNMT